jgi:hypothetical protein
VQTIAQDVTWLVLTHPHNKIAVVGRLPATPKRAGETFSLSWVNPN